MILFLSTYNNVITYKNSKKWIYKGIVKINNDFGNYNHKLQGQTNTTYRNLNYIIKRLFGFKNDEKSKEFKSFHISIEIKLLLIHCTKFASLIYLQTFFNKIICKISNLNLHINKENWTINETTDLTFLPLMIYFLNLKKWIR